MNRFFGAVLGLAATAFFALSVPSFAADMTAGTGKANIDPPPSLLPVHNMPADPQLATIHDSLFARAVVLDSEGSRIILVVADIIILPDDAYERIVTRLAKAYNLPRDHIWLTATHCHTVPWGLGNGYEQVVSDGVMAAVAQAAARPQPVTMGKADGKAFININRDERVGSGFILGQDPHGASDKTVRVAGFFGKDGLPVAILANYAVHAVTLHSSFTGGDNGMISADIPGAADAFVDARYPGALTLWSSGAAADQNPILMSYYAEPDSSGKPVSTDLRSAGLELMQRLGQNLGLEIVRTTDSMKPEVVGGLRAAQMVVNCPARDATTVPVRVSWLKVGDLDLIGVSGEVNTGIDQAMRAKLPGHDLVTMTLTNGYAGYLPDDASYARGETFEVRQSHVKGGCAETAIINAAVKLVTGG